MSDSYMAREDLDVPGMKESTERMKRATKMIETFTPTWAVTSKECKAQAN